MTDDRRFIEDLKIAVLSTGVQIDHGSLDRLGGADALTTHEYATTGGIPMRVGNEYLNAPFDEWYCAEAEVEFATTGIGHVLRYRGVDVAIDHIYPLPGYVGEVDDRGMRFDDVAYSHLDRVRLSPINGCAYDCAFCDLPGRIELRPVDQLLRAARRAIADSNLPPRHLLISGGSPGPRQWQEFADTVHTLVAELGPTLPVDVMMSSGPETAAFVDRLVDAGVHGFALNIEIASEAAASLHIRGKHRRARPHLDETIAAAVARLGRTGRVRSLILPGLEPVEETLAGVDHLAALGADPVLSPFRPARDTALHRAQTVTSETLRLVLDGSREIVAHHGVRLGPRCGPCQHNTLTFSSDAA